MAEPDGRALGCLVEDLPVKLREALKRELDEGEETLWVDQPKAGKLSRDEKHPLKMLGHFALTFSLFVGALSLVPPHAPQGQAPRKAQEASWPNLGLMALAGGLGIIAAGAYVAAARLNRARAPRRAYALTRKRLISVELAGGDKLKVSDFGPSDLGNSKRIDHIDGVGSLILQPRVDTKSAELKIFILAAVADIREVDRLIRRTFGGLTDVDQVPKA